jgi:putative peptidoglycan lipid II flippase
MKKINIGLIIAIISLVGSALGFIRDAYIGSIFGASTNLDAYFISFSVTNLLTLLIWNGVSSSMLPLLVQSDIDKGKIEKDTFFRNSLGNLLIISMLLVACGYFASGILVRMFAYGFSDEMHSLSVALTNIGLLKLPIAAVVGIIIAYLHSEKRYFKAASITIIMNATFLFLLFSWRNHLSIIEVSIISVISVFAQFLFLSPILFYAKGTNSLSLININFYDKQFIKFVKLAVPVTAFTLLNELNIMIDRTMASSLDAGSISILSFASRISDVIVSVPVVALVSVLLPEISAYFASHDLDMINKSIGRSIVQIIAILTPSSLFILINSRFIIEVLFMRGEFDTTAVIRTSSALVFYSLGIVFLGIRFLIARTMYSMHDTKTPTINLSIAIVLNICLNIILVGPFKHDGLAMSTSLSAFISCILIFWSFKAKTNFKINQRLLNDVIQIVAFSLLLLPLGYVAINGSGQNTQTILLVIITHTIWGISYISMLRKRVHLF